ncbi:hypothetical protein QYF61_020632 [Mycteria americana]|uniref:Uncharacterized protein n=1 Tax=Mycteria americana TaxID=33587 RepID=A0AAN7NWC6_MYCAM|nr:hypothetical protein QYF61_020632 [Mycteria americana]
MRICVLLTAVEIYIRNFTPLYMPSMTPYGPSSQSAPSPPSGLALVPAGLQMHAFRFLAARVPAALPRPAQEKWAPCSPFQGLDLLQAPSNLTLNVARDGASTTSLGNLFQCFTTLIVKNFFLISSLNLPSFSLKPLPLVLSQQVLLKTPFKYCKAAMRSPQSLLFSRLNNPSSLSLSSQERCSISLIIFVALLWTCSNRSMSFLCRGLQSWTQYWRWGLTRVGCRDRITSLDLLATLLLMQPRIWLAFWAASTHCQLMSSFSSTSTPKSSSAGLLSIPSSPSLCRTLHLALLNLMRFTRARFSSLSRSLWMASHPSRHVNCTTQLGVICKLAEAALDPTVYVTDEDIKQHWS